MKDYYKILGIDVNASSEEIKSAYRSEAKKYHPDITAFDKEYSRKRMSEISEAYEVLSNPDKKAAYDAALVYRDLQTNMYSTNSTKRWTEEQRRAEDQRQAEAFRRAAEQNRKETYSEPQGDYEVGGCLWYLACYFYTIIKYFIYAMCFVPAFAVYLVINGKGQHSVLGFIVAGIVLLITGFFGRLLVNFINWRLSRYFRDN